MKGDIPLFDLSAPVTVNPATAAGLKGPGSYFEDDNLSYMPMPHEMDTFEIPVLPEPGELRHFPEVGQLLDALQAALDIAARVTPEPGESHRLELNQLAAGACGLLYQTLGDGEVAARVAAADGEPGLRIQETILAGVWWIQQLDDQGQPQHQWLEVGQVPDALVFSAFDQGISDFSIGALPSGLLNGAPVVLELLDKAALLRQQALVQPHVVNLSLLPFAPEDHEFLARRLGQGRVVILSRGYGNCRISSCAVPGIWRVQYFNSTDQLILDTLEVVTIPQVACAAREDLEDSAERLREILDALRQE